MIQFVVGLIAACAVAAVAFPFVRREAGRDPDAVEPRLQELLEAKDTIYGTLKELDFDHAAGKLSEPDFRQLEAQYRERAIGILREIDALVEQRDAGDDLSEALEREILSLRKAVRGEDALLEAVEEAETVLDAPDAPPEPRFCPRCGDPASSTDNFCSSCGTPLRETS